MKRKAFHHFLRAGLVAGCALLAACGSARPPGADVGTSTSALSTENGLTANGLTANGLTANGLTANGLTANGLETSEFLNWFTTDAQMSAIVMKYLVRCALTSDETVSATIDDVQYSWTGEMGFAPGWMVGDKMSVAEEQLISACIAAHVNKYGQHVTISLRGYYADDQAIPLTEEEQTDYTDDEGCFFGNLFDGSGVYSTYSWNSPLMNTGMTSLRACAASGGSPGECGALTSAGAVQDLCTGDEDGTGNFEYRTCSLNGVDYRPVCSRLTAAQVVTCGDGICQATESCFDVNSGSGCLADCGLCPVAPATP